MPRLWGGRIVSNRWRRLLGGRLRSLLGGRLFGFRLGCRLLFGLDGCFRLRNGLLGDGVAFNFSHRFLLIGGEGFAASSSHACAVRTLIGDVAFGARYGATIWVGSARHQVG